MPKKVRILSIDGGGIRGIIPGTVLISLERKLKKKTGNPKARIADHFDLIAGTSTGGILTLLYLCPEIKGNTVRPKYAAKDAVNLYMERGDDIFDISLFQRLSSGFGVWDEKYDEEELQDAAEDYMGDIKLSQLLKPCLVTAYNIRDRKTKFFTQHDVQQDPDQDFLIRDVARATSAAPTYFEAAKIASLTNKKFPLIDGGVFANNPALCAYAEVRSKFPNKPGADKMAVLSLGTGYVKKKYPYKSAKDWGLAEWIKPLLDIMMSGVSETVDYQMERIFETVKNKNEPLAYLRVDDQLKVASTEMDDASPTNIENLELEGKRIARKFSKKIDAFLEYLVGP